MADTLCDRPTTYLTLAQIRQSRETVKKIGKLVGWEICQSRKFPQEPCRNLF